MIRSHSCASSAARTSRPVRVRVTASHRIIRIVIATSISNARARGNGAPSSVKALPAAQQESKKGEIESVLRAFRYLVKFEIEPANYAPKAVLEQIVKARGWEEKKK